MRVLPDSTPTSASLPEATGCIVSIYVKDTHPLLILKRHLDWDLIRDLMVCHWQAAGKNVSGRPGRKWPVSLYVPLLVLMSVKALSSRQMEEYLSENVVARRFLDLDPQLMPHIRDHAQIARAQSALGVLGWKQLNELIVREAVRFGFGHPETLSSDTTVQEPQIGYPHEAGILRGIAQRVLRVFVKLTKSGEPIRELVTAQARQVITSVKQYHLFAKTKEQKDKLLTELVWQTIDLMYGVQEVCGQVKASTSKVKEAAVTTLKRIAEVSATLLPQIAQWVTTGVVAQAKILHAGITEARAIVRNKEGKKVEFGFKWLINRTGGGYVFGDVVAAHGDEKKMPLHALKQYREVFGEHATPQLMVYDRGGSCGSTTAALREAGVARIGIQPVGRAEWLVAAEDQKVVKAERARTEASIGTLKSRRYSFQQRTERSNKTLRAAGQRALASMNLVKMMRELTGRERKAEVTET